MKNLETFCAARLASISLAVLACGAATPVLAQGCRLDSGTTNLLFGTISHKANTDTAADVKYTCDSIGEAIQYRVCLYVPDGAGPSAGVGPRTMLRPGGGSMKFDMYYDPARTKVIGTVSSANYPAEGDVFVAPAGGAPTIRSLRIYGRVPPNQDLAGGFYFYTPTGFATLRWAWSRQSAPSSCTGPAQGTGSQTDQRILASADVSSSCRITSVSDMDFGTAANLSRALTTTARIFIRCPFGLPWSVGLGNGLQPQGGVRRMKNADEKFIPYYLYKNAARTLPAGAVDTPGDWRGIGDGESAPDILTVYGEVRADMRPVFSGSYSDTVVITLKF